MTDLEIKIRKMIAWNVKHKTKGYRLDDVEWPEISRHLNSECHEASVEMTTLAVAGYGEEAIISELGDILGIVIHAANKLGFTLADVEAAELKKLDERFEQLQCDAKSSGSDCAG